MTNRKLRRIKTVDTIYYVELKSHSVIDGSPIYEARRAWYLCSYLTHWGMRHIVSLSDSLDCTVVRHIPDNRVFDTKQEAENFIVQLNNNEVKYDQY